VFEKQPVLRPDSSGDIGEYLELRCLGHGMRLRRVFIPGFQPQTGDDVGAVVRLMLESHVLGATKIKRSVGLGLVQDTGIPIGVMDPILTYASNALEMFALIGGGIEHGVRADKEFYFTVRQHVVKQTYPIGGRIEAYMPLESSDDEVHRIWIQGGNGTVYPVDVVPFQVGNQKDLFVSVAGVNSQASAQLWATGYASAHAPGSTTPAGRLRLVGGADWIESVGQPIGLLRVIGGPVFVAAGDRLDALLPMKLADMYGNYTDTSFRVRSINYQPDGDFLQVDVDMGSRGNALEDLLEAIEYKLGQTTQALQTQ